MEDHTTDQYNEFRKFVQRCHKNKIRVIIDMVLDHTSKDSIIQRLHPEWYLYKKNPLSLDDPYVYQEEDPQRTIWGSPAHVFSPFDHDIFWSDCGMLNWNFRYPRSPNAAPPNPSIATMRQYFKDLLKYWIKNFGVDGFRLDVSYAIPPDFWHEAVAEVRAYAKTLNKGILPLSPDITFIGESYVDDIYDLQASGITAVNGDFSNKIWNVESLKGYLDYAYNINGNSFLKDHVGLISLNATIFIAYQKNSIT